MIAAALAAVSVSGLWLFRPRPAPLAAGFPVPLAPYLGSEWSAAFSPDDRQVAFAWNGERKDNYDIYLKANGSDIPTRLTTDPATDLSPVWSPDGRRIAFLRDLGRCRVAVMMIPAVGGPEVKIAETDPLVCVPYYRNLAFSPDGSWLITAAVDADAPGQHARTSGLFLYSVENGSRRPLTLPPAGYSADTNPALSPDGRSLAFLRGPESVSQDLYVLPLDRNWSASGEPRRLTPWNRVTMNPAWTADGREIIVASGEFEHSRLWRVPVSGSGGASVIAPAGDVATLPALARDGRLAFTRVAPERQHLDAGSRDVRQTGLAPAPVAGLVQPHRYQSAVLTGWPPRRVRLQSHRHLPDLDRQCGRKRRVPVNFRDLPLCRNPQLVARRIHDRVRRVEKRAL